jgi:hypothetical protein
VGKCGYVQVVQVSLTDSIVVERRDGAERGWRFLRRLKCLFIV